MANSNSTSPKRAQLIRLDFHPDRLERSLEALLEMAKSGAIDGIVFAARTGRKSPTPYIFGCEGWLENNRAESIGAAELLKNELLSA